MAFIFNKDKETKQLEKQALKVNKKATENLNSFYNSFFNCRTGDMSIFCYEYHLQEIIKKGK